MAADGRGGGSAAGHPAAGGAARAPEKAVRDLERLLLGLRWEGSVCVDDADDYVTVVPHELAMYEAIQAVISYWSAHYNIQMDDDAEVCEPSSNNYASGIGFSHYASEACYGVLATGEHIHVRETFGYVYGKAYHKVEQVAVEYPSD